MSQSSMSFPGAPLPGTTFINELTTKLLSLASSRSGALAPSDVQEGEIWVKTPDMTPMLRKGGVDVNLIATTAQALAGTDDASAITPLKLAQALAQFGFWGTENIPDIGIIDTYNNVKTTCFKTMRNTDTATGAPNFGEICYLISLRHNASWSVQFVISMNSARTAVRSREGDVWGEWKYTNDASNITSGTLANDRSSTGSHDTATLAAFSAGVLTIDCNYGACWHVTSTNITSIVFANRPSGQRRAIVTLELIGNANISIAWGNIRWSGGVAPTLDFSGGKTNYVTLEILPSGNWVLGTVTAVGAPII